MAFQCHSMPEATFSHPKSPFPIPDAFVAPPDLPAVQAVKISGCSFSAFAIPKIFSAFPFHPIPSFIPPTAPSSSLPKPFLHPSLLTSSHIHFAKLLISHYPCNHSLISFPLKNATPCPPSSSFPRPLFPRAHVTHAR